MGTASVDQAGERYWDGPHREAASPVCGLYFGRNGEAWSGVVDFARRGVTMRDRDGECTGAEADGPGELAVADEEDSHSRRRPVKAKAFDSLLSTAERHRPFPGGLRRIPHQQALTASLSLRDSL